MATTSEFADTLSVLLIEQGSEGVEVADYEEVKRVLDTHSWDYADGSLYRESDGVAYVSGFYAQDHDFAALHERLNELRGMRDLPVGSLELHLEKIDSADYENEWKKYYAPIELSRVVVVPAWQKYAGDKIPVYIDPGMAFGTGSHETTKLCLRFLEQADVAGKACADIGCGSGILGAAALKLGASSCYMSDIDPQAVDAAKRNLAANGVLDKADVCVGSVPQNGQTFAVAVANITADVLILLEHAVASVLQEDGTLIVSGIIHSRADEVLAAYEKDFCLVQRQTDGEWQGMLFRKKAAAQ